jgi:hypothetical protein
MVVEKKLFIKKVVILSFLVLLVTKKIIFAATWSGISPIPSDNKFLLEDLQYKFNPATAQVTATYQYRNISGTTITNPRVVNLFTWSDDICSAPWLTMAYGGLGLFSNADQSVTALNPDGYFNWNTLITAPAPPLDSSGLFPALPLQSTQNGSSYPYWYVCTGTANQWADQEVATITLSWSVLNPYWLQSLNWIASCQGIDCPLLPPDDNDGVVYCDDNCKNIANPTQAATFHPGGNECGNACECEGDFNSDGKVDGTDAANFKKDFGRNAINNPCSNAAPCKGDFTCDKNVSGTDAAQFKSDFGRNSLNNPCPLCPTVLWCRY